MKWACSECREKFVATSMVRDMRPEKTGWICTNCTELLKQEREALVVQRREQTHKKRERQRRERIAELESEPQRIQDAVAWLNAILDANPSTHYKKTRDAKRL